MFKIALNRVPVSSSNIESIGYDPASSILEVGFSNDSLYEYNEVPPEIYQDFIAAPSKGQFLYYNIRDLYPYVRTREPAFRPKAPKIPKPKAL